MTEYDHNETYGPGGYLPGVENAPEVRKAFPDAPPGNLIALEIVPRGTATPDLAPDAQAVAVPAESDVLRLLTTVNDGKATDADLANLAALIAGQGVTTGG